MRDGKALAFDKKTKKGLLYAQAFAGYYEI